MAGKSSNLGASASSSASTKMVKQQEKRKQRATRAGKAKKPRGTGTAVPGVVPLHRGASNNMATPAFPFPMAGVNGGAPLWSTAATLGAASRAAALTLSSLPATASANGPAAAPFAIAPATGLQPPPAGAAASNTAAAALALPAASAATAFSPPLVLAHAGAGGQLVPLPLQFVGYHPTCRASAVGLPAPVVGIPLAAALDKIENGALGRMLSALMPVCNPPLRQHQSKSGPPPPWWPTGSEDWWATELLAHLDTVAALMHAPVPVPFAPSYSLKKAQKVAVLVAIVKHLAPGFARVAAAVRHSGKLSVSETDMWHSALNNERAKCMRPMFIVLPQQQGGVGGGSASTDPSAAGSVVVHSGNAASDGCELQVATSECDGFV